MIERNVGSNALIGGKARIGGNAFGGRKEEAGTVLFDGTVTLDDGEGEIELNGELIPGATVVVTVDGVEHTGTVTVNGGYIGVDTGVIYIDSSGYLESNGGTGTVTLTVVQNPAPPYISGVDAATVSLGSHDQLSTTVIPSDSVLSATSADESVATVSVSDNVVTVTGVSEGSATITLTATYDGLSSSKDVAITVNDK